MWNLEVRDRRLRLHRLALPSPAEIISTRADGTSIAASHGYANGTCGRGTVVSQAPLAEQTRVYNGEWIYRSPTKNRFSCSRVSTLHTKRASKGLPFAARKHIRQMLKSKQAQVLPSFKTEEKRKCNLQVARTRIAENVCSLQRGNSGIAFARRQKSMSRMKIL